MSPARLRMLGAADLEDGRARVAENVGRIVALRHMMLTVLRHCWLQDRPSALVFSATSYPAAPPVRLNHVFILPLVWRAADGSLVRCAQELCRSPLASAPACSCRRASSHLNFTSKPPKPSNVRRGFILVVQPSQAAFETASFETLAPKQQQHLTDLYHDHMQVRLRQGL